MDENQNQESSQEKEIHDQDVEAVLGAMDEFVAEEDESGESEIESIAPNPRNREKVVINGVEYYGMEDAFSEKEFLRSVCAELATSNVTPADIYKAELSEPESSCVEYVISESYAQMAYSCSVGYDRTEKYTVWDNYKKEYVEKRKTVTDWHPYKGECAGNYIACTKNADEEQQIDRRVIEKITNEFKNGELVPALDEGIEMDELLLNPNSKKRMNKQIASGLLADIRRKNPGDRTKDIHGTPKVRQKRLASVRIPKWNVKFNYDGEQFERESMAHEEYKGNGNLPKKSDAIKYSVDISKEVAKCKLLPVLGGASIASSVIACVFGLLVKKTAYMSLLPLVIVFGLLSIGAIVYYFVKRNQIVAPLVKQIVSETMPKFDDWFKKYGLDAPTDEEKTKIEEKISTSANTMEAMGCLGIFFVVLAIILCCVI